MNKVELLAPAGSFDALKAAVASGADAVYLGGSGFGARAFAKNFDYDEMIEAIKFAHLYNVKIYVTINTLVYDHELKDVLNYVTFLYQNDVDAVIVQDLGLLNLIKTHFPDLEIHASTQMTIHNTEGVKFLKSLGIDRIVLARENTIDQIKKIINKTGIDIEVFVHGAICVSYSGQCLMSGLIGGRSGNRGKCAQPCRKRYTLKVNNQTITSKKYLLSPKDLYTLENIDQLIDTGIKSLKIEGRMKSPEYVSIVVGAYRKAIDQYYKSKKVLITPQDQLDVTQIFNRQFTKGFLFNEKGNAFINLEKNNNTGVLVGKVISCEHQKVKIKLSKDLNLQDGIYFDQTEVGMTVSKIVIKNQSVKSAKVNDLIILDVPKPIKPNTFVYRTTDVSLEEKARMMASNLQIIPIKIEVDLFLNQKPTLKVIDDLGNKIVEEVDFIVEKSKNQKMDESKIIDQLNKLGNTPFKLTNININCDDSIFITMGALNQLRRNAIDQLIEKRQMGYNREVFIEEYHYRDNESVSSNSEGLLSVYVRTLEQLKAALEFKNLRIYVDEELKYEINDNTSELYLSKARIEYQHKFDLRYNGCVISNLGTLYGVKSQTENREMISNFNLNVTNSETIKFLLVHGIDRVTLSHELNENSLKTLNFKDKSKLEIIVYGYQEAMVTKHCVYAANCQKQCKVGNHQLIDDKNEGFSFYTDQLCHMHILNSKKLLLFDELKELSGLGYQFRLQFTIEDYDETLHTIKAYQDFLYNGIDTELKLIQNNLRDSQKYTRGYYQKAY